ncbi:hypothetical protein [Mycobacterium antarcticum]|uniref:hypothetical protein n=1 Tax=Mycolicibacterium sp. TUM20983 TaxID=3023369 RepID=UPI0024E045D7|nr:hypothetical protein [Mycolicibacterium sp. TUM20983]
MGPVNSQVAQWTSATLPANWTSYRDTWEAAHAVAAAVSFVALAVLLVATIWLPVSEAHCADPPSRRK